MKTFKFKGLLILLAVLAARAGNAERYIATVTSRPVFEQIHTQFLLSEHQQLSNYVIQAGRDEIVRPFLGLNIRVEDSLDHLQSLVLETQDPEEMTKLEATGWVTEVEKEIFHPSPMPLLSYRPWKIGDVAITAPQGSRILTETPSMPWGIRAVKAPEAWALNGKGAGARVLVLDTGIDHHHPALARNFEEGRDFTGNGNPNDVTDKVGHGSHVAGTIAGVELVTGFAGVAPEAKLLAGRVCSEKGCSNVAVAQGINWGINKKVDVINMSLGGPVGSMAEKRAVEAAAQAGVTVVAASGNSGTARISYPAAFADSVAVGAVDSNLRRASFSQYGPELAVMAPGVSIASSVPLGTGRVSKVIVQSQLHGTYEVKSTSFVGSPQVKNPLTNEVVACNLGKVGHFPKEVAGRFALIERGEITFAEKVKNAIDAGAAGVVLFNNEQGLIQGAVSTDGSTVDIPVVMIEQNVGRTLVQEIRQGKHPRVMVRTTGSDYAALDGTSMASPHVAGVAALMKAARHTLTPAQIKRILKASASTLGDSQQYGSGLVNAEKALIQVLGP